MTSSYNKFEQVRSSRYQLVKSSRQNLLNMHLDSRSKVRLLSFSLQREMITSPVKNLFYNMLGGLIFFDSFLIIALVYAYEKKVYYSDNPNILYSTCFLFIEIGFGMLMLLTVVSMTSLCRDLYWQGWYSWHRESIAYLIQV